MRQTRVGTLLFPEVEVPDFAGPQEAVTTASRFAGRRQSGAAPHLYQSDR